MTTSEDNPVEGPAAAPAVVAALDGLVLDALVRGEHDSAKLAAAAEQLTRR